METVSEFLDKLALEGVKLSAQAGRLNCYARKGALTNELQDGILRFKPQLIALFEEREEREQRQKRRGEFPLSAGQKGLYILQSLHPAMSAYNVPLCFRINAAVDAGLLGQAWDRVQSQFPLLTARMVQRDGALYQRLDDACRTTIAEQSIALDADDALLAFLQARAKQPFDLDRGPLARIELFRRAQQKSILLLTVHHIVFDGVSAVIVLRALLDFYSQLSGGTAVRAAAPHAGYEEFVAWEEAMLASAEGAAHARYWEKQLDSDAPAVELLPDFPRTAAASLDGKTLTAELPEELAEWVRLFSKTHALPSSVIFLGLFQLLLHRFTGQDDVVVGMPVMGRAAQRFAFEVGYFINMVPLRARCGEALLLLDFLRKVQGTTLDALYHSSYPFPLMAGRRKGPVFRISYAYQNFVDPTDFLSLLQQQTFALESVTGVLQEGDFDLGLEIYEGQSGAFNLHLKYNPALYTQATVASVLEHYVVLLRAVRENPALSVHDYPLHTLPVDVIGTAAESQRQQCIHDLFLEQAERRAEETAVVFGEERLTYGQLQERSHALALHLQSLGVTPDGLVALCMAPSLDRVVAMLAILRAGGAYVPLHPDDPAERLAFLLRDSGAAVVLTDPALQDKLRVVMAYGTRLVIVDAQPAEHNVPLRREVRPHHLACVLYTSGSAGPLGVAIEHHGLVALAAAGGEIVAPYEMLVTLANGGTVRIEVESLQDGDAETPIPSASRRVYVLDAHQHPQPVGAIGELYVAGEGLARGYWNRPELTQERFAPNPFVPGTRMFRTGERARWTDDRNMQPLGRSDRQVRIGGMRIEPGEIEAQLVRYPRVQAATVIVHGAQLVAFYRAEETTDDHLVEVPVEELRSHMARMLPAAMVPARFVSLAVIPDDAALVEILLKQQRAYWQDTLAGMPETLDLAADFPRAAVATGSDASHTFLLDAPLTAQLQRLAERKGATLLVVLLAAVKVLLHRYTDSNDICVGTPIESTADGTLALRSRIDGEDTFSAFVSQVKVTCAEGYRNQDVPFEEMVDLLRPYGDTSLPLFPVVVGLQERRGKADLVLRFAETPAGLAGSLAYSTALYEPRTVARFAEHLEALCRSIAASPTARIRTLAFLGDTERQQVLIAFNSTSAEPPAGKLVHQLFADRARSNPDATAVTSGEAKLTYRELNQQSRALALHLQSLGVKPDDVVGICTERSLEMIVAIVAVMQSGAAYLPVEPTSPDGSLAYLLQDSRARYVLTHDSFKHRLRSLLAHDAKLIPLNTPLASNGTALREAVHGDHAAYVTYAAGSVGKPRGVAIGHAALASRMAWMQSRYALDSHDAVLQTTPYSSHASVLELFWPLTAGAAIVLAAPGLHIDESITTLHLTPSMLQGFLADGGTHWNSVTRIFCSGGVLDPATVARCATRFPNATLHQLYGPAEAAFPVTAYDGSDVNRAFVPIGKPVAGTRIYVLDRDGRPQPIGITGELHIGGDGLAAGYLNLPKATQDSFVANPFTPATRMYKTADLVRWLDDGNLQYVRPRV